MEENDGKIGNKLNISQRTVLQVSLLEDTQETDNRELGLREGGVTGMDCKRNFAWLTLSDERAQNFVVSRKVLRPGLTQNSC